MLGGVGGVEKACNCGGDGAGVQAADVAMQMEETSCQLQMHRSIQ